MLYQLRNAEQRRLLWGMMSELMEETADAWFGGDREFGEATAYFALVSGILLGHAEGRPMNASKLAHFAHMARPTAYRRLKELEAEEIIVRFCKNYYLRKEIANSDHLDRLVRKWVRRLRDTSATLSKMDS